MRVVGQLLKGRLGYEEFPEGFTSQTIDKYTISCHIFERLELLVRGANESLGPCTTPRRHARIQSKRALVEINSFDI